MRKLEALGLKYDYKDVTESEMALNWVKEMGYQQVPVVVPSFDKNVVDAKGERVVHWSGFRPDYLDQLKTS